MDEAEARVGVSVSPKGSSAVVDGHQSCRRHRRREVCVVVELLLLFCGRIGSDF
jgi:hypothetical protein